MSVAYEMLAITVMSEQTHPANMLEKTDPPVLCFIKKLL
jgi:hypothetical protein